MYFIHIPYSYKNVLHALTNEIVKMSFFHNQNLPTYNAKNFRLMLKKYTVRIKEKYQNMVLLIFQKFHFMAFLTLRKKKYTELNHVLVLISQSEQHV